MVLVTPHLVRPMNPDEVPALPTQTEKFLPAPDAPAREAPQERQVGSIMALTKRVQRAVSDERGAVLVQVAIAILVLTAMATFVVDHGVLWVSRGQAQNAADAGALSGAIARAYDDLTAGKQRHDAVERDGCGSRQ